MRTFSRGGRNTDEILNTGNMPPFQEAGLLVCLIHLPGGGQQDSKKMSLWWEGLWNGRDTTRAVEGPGYFKIVLVDTALYYHKDLG